MAAGLLPDPKKRHGQGLRQVFHGVFDLAGFAFCCKARADIDQGDQGPARSAVIAVKGLYDQHALDGPPVGGAHLDDLGDCLVRHDTLGSERF